MSADYWHEVWSAIWVLAPFFVVLLLLRAVFWLIDRAKKGRRVWYAEGIVEALESDGEITPLKVALHLREKGAGLPLVVIGWRSSVPTSVVAGVVVRVGYYSTGDQLVVKGEIVEVENLDKEIVDAEVRLRDLRLRVRGIRGGPLPERTRDDLS